MEDLFSLSHGPTKYLTHCNGYIINGYRFHVEDYDKKLRTQNYGVVVVGDSGTPGDNVDYYGVLTEVIELQFIEDRRVILFRLFYVNDNSNKVWQVARKTQPRDSYETLENKDDDIEMNDDSLELGSSSEKN
ncbi:putative protein isoform X1 [Capsicum chacoense]